MAYEFIGVERRDRLTVITMQRPEVMNAVHPAMAAEMQSAFDAFAADAEAWVAILTGAGARAFSAGNDLKWTAAHGAPALPPGGFGGLTARFDLHKPVIAALNGLALGGGLEMAIACDLVVAAEHATLGLPEPRVGLMAAAGGVHRLPRQLPLKVAMGMLLTGRPITAQQGREVGLINEVVAAADLRACAERWAGWIIECSPLSIQATKQAALDGLGRPLPEALAGRYPAVSALFRSADAREGPRAFAEKRAPRWQGR